MYPAIMSGSNKEMQIISKVMAELRKIMLYKRYQAHMQMIGSSSGSRIISPSSPTPIDPTSLRQLKKTQITLHQQDTITAAG